MMMTLGKRKRRASLDPSTAQTSQRSDHDRYQTLMRQHFEAAYEPLEVQPESSKLNHAIQDPEDDAESSAWSGFSADSSDVEENGTGEIEIVDHARATSDNDGDALRMSRKSFMSSKLPSDAALRALRQIKHVGKGEDHTSEASLAADDLALQRLLRESKLLSNAGVNDTGASLTLSGQSRHRALDAHVQYLGAKGSIHEQKSMPLTQRVGINKKAKLKEATRRREAREAGIVLEKVKHAPRERVMRDRGVGAPGVGRFKGGTLTLSAKDVRQIQGSGHRLKGKRKRK